MLLSGNSILPLSLERKRDPLMTMFTTKDKQTIWASIDFLISHGQRVAVQIEGQAGTYTSKIIKASYSGAYSKGGDGPHLIIGELAPKDGYAFIKPGRGLRVKFVTRKTTCGFRTVCLGTLFEEHDRKIIASFPKSVDLPERRRGHRGSSEMPEFVSVVFSPQKGLKAGKNFDLAVVDYSRNGVGVFISEEDSELIEGTRKGDKLKDITLFASEAIVKVDGTVIHKSKRKRRGRQNEDFYVLGIEFDEVLMDFNALG
jgi:sulfur carrier protein ThiS